MATVKISCITENISPLNETLNIIGFAFSSDMDFLKANLLYETFKKGIGQLGAYRYKQSPYFFSQSDFDSQELTPEDIANLDNNIDVYLAFFENLISSFWLIKDNCCSLSSIHLFLPEHKRLLEKSTNVRYSTCDGRLNVVQPFSKDEISRAVDTYLKASNLFYHQTFKIKKVKSTESSLIAKRERVPYDVKKITRIERAFGFLGLARSTSQLPQKIAFYVCIYESLFSGNSQGEISHQLGERIALYASDSRFFRRSIYKQFKDAYAIRSSYFHGGSLSKSEAQLKSISKFLDDLTREVLNRIVLKDADIFSQTDGSLEKSFRDLLFEDERRPSGLTIEDGLDYLQFRNELF